MLQATTKGGVGGVGGGSRSATPQHTHHSAASTDTELTTLDTHELWLQEPEPTPCAMSALHQFGAEMLKLSRGLEAAAVNTTHNTNAGYVHSQSLFHRTSSTAPKLAVVPG